MKDTKKNQKLHGNLIRPIKIGKPAVFSSENVIYRTSAVTILHEHTKDYIDFETENTHYQISIQPIPQTAITPFPIRLVACA